MHRLWLCRSEERSARTCDTEAVSYLNKKFRPENWQTIRRRYTLLYQGR